MSECIVCGAEGTHDVPVPEGFPPQGKVCEKHYLMMKKVMDAAEELEQEFAKYHGEDEEEETDDTTSEPA